MEFTDLLGATEERARNRAGLDAVQSLLEARDARGAKRPARRRKR